MPVLAWKHFRSNTEMDEVELTGLNYLFRDLCYFQRVSNDQVLKAMDLIRQENTNRPWILNAAYEGLEFDNKAKRCAYVRRYGGCHCALARQCTLELLVRMPAPELDRLFIRGTLKVVSVGGGPGNDLIGFCSAVSELNRSRSLRLTVVDKKSGWKHVFESLVFLATRGNFGSVSHMFRSVHLIRNFVKSDLSDHTLDSSILEADVILMTKVLSWVTPTKKREILQKIFASMKKNAIFIFIDISSDLVLRVAQASGMCLLLKSTASSEFLYWNHADPSSITKSTYEMCVVQNRNPLPLVTNGFYYW